jgi:hypothetical protein
MTKIKLRNIFWIALLAVWSFLAGAYFHLGWVRDRSFSFQAGFILGGIAMWLVFVGIGIFVYRFSKKQGFTDPSKLALGIISFFTVIFLLIAGIKYSDVQKDKFVEELEPYFVEYYTDKAAEKGSKIEQLDLELHDLYFMLSYDLLKQKDLPKLMQLTSSKAIFQDHQLISDMCVKQLKTEARLGYPPPKGLLELFEHD